MATKFVVVYNRVPELSGLLRKRAGDAAHQAAQMTEQFIKSEMQQPKSGRTYKRGRKYHQASAPGESPAVDMGHLANSIQTERQDMMAAVFTNAEQAEVLELGGRHVAARPFMSPAVADVRPRFWQLMRGVMESL